jgi:hypothetical protein
LGYSGAVGDLDGDGKVEVFMGAVAASVTATEPDYRGAVAAFESPLSTVNQVYNAGTFVLRGSDPLMMLGSSVVVGDFDGDGVDDLVAGAFSDSRVATYAGALFVIYGPHRAGGAIDSVADWSAIGDTADESVGSRLFSVGDISGDGVADFAMGSDYGTSSPSVPDGGSVQIFTQASSGVTLARESSSTLLYSDTSADSIGAAVSALDLDADGIQDIAVGSPSGGDDDEGTAGLFFGPLAANLDYYDADIRWEGVDSLDKFGYALSGGDMNLDGADDLLVSANTEGSEDGANGSIYIFFGGSGVVATAVAISAGDAEHKIRNDEPDVSVNYLHQLGDLNKDGAPDLGASGLNAAIFYGPFEGGVRLASTYDVLLSITSGYGEFTQPVMINGGDLFGDGGDDLVIGSPRYDGGEDVDGYGRTYIIPGISW